MKSIYFLCAIYFHATRTNATLWGGVQWGVDGHEITALVAEGFLTSKTYSKIEQILKNADFAQVSTWPDRVKHEKQYHWSAPLHFWDTPDFRKSGKPCVVDYDRDCVNDVCVGGAIQNYTRRLINQTGVQEDEAAMFLIHFLGDIHQPLHVSFRDDRGGNQLLVRSTWFHGVKNLHTVWDDMILYRIIDSDFDSSYGKYAKHLIDKLSNEWRLNATYWATCPEGTRMPCSTVWAQESIDNSCGYAYRTSDGKGWLKSGDMLDELYFERARPIIEKSLAKGGFRLAALLNGIFDHGL